MDDELCKTGEKHWRKSHYRKYREHIWKCKKCQKALGLTKEDIAIQKEFDSTRGEV
jgi:hypothetical protein